MPSIYCFDPTANDEQSRVRGVGRYMQILKENFPDWHLTNSLEIGNWKLEIFVNPFFNFLQPPLSIKRIAKKQIAVIHDLIPLKYPSHFPIGLRGKLNVFLNKMALKNYDVIVTDSEASKKDIIKILGINEAKIRIIYPCLPKIFTQSTPITQKKNRYHSSVSSVLQSAESVSFALYVGDATWNKNLVNLARAIKEINVTCVFVGKVFERAVGVPSEVPRREPDSGLHRRGSQARRDHEEQNLLRATNPWQNELQQFLQVTQNDKRFVFAGFIPDADLINLYQQSRCNILPSRDEGFGFSYLEAASQASPSILADIPVLHEISGDQGCLFANPNDVSALANNIGELYFRKDRRVYLGFKAQEQSKHFNSEGFRRDFLSSL